MRNGTTGGKPGRAAPNRRLENTRREAEGCRRCGLWKAGTQTVFGDGDPDARLMLVGEQPGDAEDLAGKPFVGPAGRILREALAAAGLADTPHYLTNAVKHFKWEPRGKRRLHLKPNTTEILACHYWLEQEIAAVQPLVLVALGATAARALLGPTIRVTRDRGRWIDSPYAPHVTVTVHPSSILRARDDDERADAMRAIVADLHEVAARLRSLG